MYIMNNKGPRMLPCGTPEGSILKLLTTFITRFCFNKLSFGISSAPEIFQHRMNEVLSDLPGVLCHIDDILVYGKDTAEHNTRLHATLQRIKTAGITLNDNKCHFNQLRIIFLGHVINQNGISPDPKKTTAIQKWLLPHQSLNLDG